MTPDLLQDRARLAAFRDGRRDVLAEVYRAHVRDVALLLRRGFMYSTDGQPTRFAGVRSDLELEAHLQEVFTRAFAPRARLSFDGLRPYGAFLAGIARNVVLDELRRRARRGEVLAAPEQLDEVAAEVAPPAESADERRGGELVRAFLDSACDARDRTLYVLRFERELSQVEAAGAAGLTRIQVRRWERTFRERLVRFLKRADYVREP